MIFISSHSIIFSIFLVSFVSRTFGSNFLNEHASTNYHIWKDFHIFPDYEVKNIFSLYGNSSSNISHSNDFQTWLHADNKMNNVSEFKAYFLGFQSSCSDLVYLPSSISMLNGKIGKWYSDIQVLYLFFPKTTPLTKIQKLPCLEFIEAPKLWTYQQFFGFSAIPMGFGGKGGQGSSNLAAGMQLLQGMQGMLGEGSGMPFMQGMQGGGGMQQMLGNQLASQLMGEFGFPGMDGEMMNPNSGNQGYPSSQPNYPPPLSNPDNHSEIPSQLKAEYFS
ncbi:hypothetical protein HMI55_004879 [Coelomomyces lativittatus]|nr:hypothetical protein HMI55_004879 [Coelomomyces lativittatus]